jgi:hypothetical protein
MNISKAVDELISHSPFLEEALAEELINISSLARKFRPRVEEMVKSPVQEGAIMMAIKRRKPANFFKITKGLKRFMNDLGDVIVRSNLHEYTYANSLTLTNCHLELMKELATQKDLFCTLCQGVFESTIIVSNSLSGKVEEIFRNESLICEKQSLSSITIRLPAYNTTVPGVYYYILKKLAWAGINIQEVISTTNEFSLVLTESEAFDAFPMLMNLKKGDW